ncbi:MAG: multi-sensor signal transduction histidine kinase, partial [Myxococcales bacterium]|nr:multi-sensor signal transduction histidine kinase [Myxococcales bacterium]
MSAILIVDDSLTVRMDLADALEAAGFQPVPCESLAEARVALRARTIALAILDVRLPDGDGVSFLEELRADPKLAELPILMLSSEAEVKDRIRGLKTGATDYVGKPYDTGFVIARVGELVDVGRVSSGRLVLVIDDSPTFRAGLVEALERSGYQTLVASSGAEGLRIASIRRPAAIIVDGVMPEMDGPTVIRRVRLDLALRTTPCVLLTGSEDAAAEIHALDVGADAFVRKESDMEVILARVAAVLRTARDERPVAAASSMSPKRILAVDDSATYLDALGDQLRDEGYDVVLATSGAEAIELLAVQNVDCILLDRMMPGLSGAETCERIKSAPIVRDIPLIMLTALEGRDVMIDGLAAGADDFISKSSGLDVLKARVKAQIRRKQFEDEHRRVREQLLRSEHEAAEARVARELAETRVAFTEQLERNNIGLAAANNELEAFSYSVSHDLRAPLRSIAGFTRMLGEELDNKLDDTGRDHLRRVLAATARMTDLIDALLELSRISRAPLGARRVDLSALSALVIEELQRRDPDRLVTVTIAPELAGNADTRLVRILLDNLLGNAWKFTAKRDRAHIELGKTDTEYFVRDDGAGFDMAYAKRLFLPFQRLHAEAEFSGTGIGLATVRRIVER